MPLEDSPGSGGKPSRLPDLEAAERAQHDVRRSWAALGWVVGAMPVVEGLLAVLGQLLRLAGRLHLDDAQARPVHVHDAVGCVRVLELGDLFTVRPVALEQLVQVSLRLAALTAGVVAPSLDELAERSLDLLAAAHRVRSGAAGRRRSTRSGTAPCGLPRAARPHDRGRASGCARSRQD